MKKNENNSQPNIERIIRETTEENQSKTDWTKAWSTRYPILKTYQAEVDIPHYATDIYSHFLKSSDKTAAEKLERLFEK